LTYASIRVIIVGRARFQVDFIESGYKSAANALFYPLLIASAHKPPMKKIAWLIAIALSVVSTVGASATFPDKFNHKIEKPKWTYTYSGSIMKYYLGSIVGGNFDPDVMSFQGVTARHEYSDGSSIYADLSLGKDLRSRFNSDFGTEIDVTFGRNFSLGPIAVNCNAAYLLTYPIQNRKGDVVSAATTVSVPECPFAEPYMTITNFRKLREAGSGWFLYGGLRRSDKIGTFEDEPLKLGTEYRAGYASEGLFGTGRGLAYHRFSVSLITKLGDWTVTPTFITQIGGKGQPRGRQFVPDGAHYSWLVGFSRTL
jgi:hypothetical protein